MSVLTFKKGISTNLNNEPIEDGKILFTIDDGKLYIDCDADRIEIKAGGDEEMADTCVEQGVIEIYKYLFTVYLGNNREGYGYGYKGKIYTLNNEIEFKSTIEQSSGEATNTYNTQEALTACDYILIDNELIVWPNSVFTSKTVKLKFDGTNLSFYVNDVSKPSEAINESTTIAALNYACYKKK